jgi:chromatin assembly factor 1 subunit A
MKLNSFFVQKTNISDRTSMSPAPSNPSLGAPAASPAPPTPNKTQASYYDRQFPPFFVQANVSVAPINRFGRDEETSEKQERIIDSYILENRSPGRERPFDALSLFNLPVLKTRGKRCVPVRELIAEMSSTASRPIDLTSASPNSQIRRTDDLLKKVPLKYLKFAEDVRPPYRGTYTSQPLHGIVKLARNPLRRDLPDTNYDYDSEAEWIEDEDAEDLNSEGEEDDAEIDDIDSMDGFLDDENDELLTLKRQVLQGDLEPVSTGLCWENGRGKNTAAMMQYRMETILGKLSHPLSSSKVIY